MRLWLFKLVTEKTGYHEFDIPITVVIRSTNAYSAAKVFDKQYSGPKLSSDDYDVTELKQNGKSGVICCDIREG